MVVLHTKIIEHPQDKGSRTFTNDGEILFFGYIAGVGMTVEEQYSQRIVAYYGGSPAQYGLLAEAYGVHGRYDIVVRCTPGRQHYVTIATQLTRKQAIDFLVLYIQVEVAKLFGP